MNTAYITHHACDAHNMGAYHPESPGRLAAIQDALIANHLNGLLHHYDAPLAEWADIERVHNPDYVATLRALSPSEGIVHLDGDTSLCPASLTAARHAAGAGVFAVDKVLDGKENNAFCAVRPPGHHAERGRAMGFCLFNNIAIAARYALDVRGLARVAILDFDVHHGNGTEQIVRDDPRMLLCSSFQHPFYPNTPLIEAPNIHYSPLKAGAYSEDFQAAVLEWIPKLEAHRPEMILVSAGFDAHWEDDMGQINLVDSDYLWVTLQIVEAAARLCDHRVVSMLEGGYELKALGRSVVQHLRGLMGVHG